MNSQSTVTNAALYSMKSNFGLLKYIFLTVLTLGIYGLYVFAKMGTNLNTIAGMHDGKNTMNYWLLALLIGPLTLGIGYFVWNHKFCARLGNELKRRQIPRNISAATYWLWNVLGILILVGPLVYVYKLCHAMNDLIDDAKAKGI